VLYVPYVASDTILRRGYDVLVPSTEFPYQFIYIIHDVTCPANTSPIGPEGHHRLFSMCRESSYFISFLDILLDRDGRACPVVLDGYFSGVVRY